MFLRRVEEDCVAVLYEDGVGCGEHFLGKRFRMPLRFLSSNMTILQRLNLNVAFGENKKQENIHQKVI